MSEKILRLAVVEVGWYLNMTSFMASCASAWTPEFLIDRDQIQHPNFTTTKISLHAQLAKGITRRRHNYNTL